MFDDSVTPRGLMFSLTLIMAFVMADAVGGVIRGDIDGDE